MAIRRRGKNWVVDVRINGKRIVRTIGPNKREAQDYEHKIKVEAREGKFFDTDRSNRSTVKTLLEDYFQLYSNHNHKPATTKRHMNSVKNLQPFFGLRLLKEVDPTMIQKYIQQRTKDGAKPGTINRETSLLSHAFNLAIKWQWVRYNPCRAISKLREPKGRVRYLTPEEKAALYKEIPWYILPVVQFALYTGMRKEEILSLKWHQVSLKDRLIFLEETKNGERRSVPLNDTAVAILFDVGKVRSTSAYVFFNPLTNDRWKDIHHQFLKACKRAGVKDFRFHDLRHTAASYLVMSGVDIAVVKEILGHKTFEMTLKYAHLSQTYKVEAVKKLDFAFEKRAREEKMVTKWLQNSSTEESVNYSRELTGQESDSVVGHNGFEPLTLGFEVRFSEKYAELLSNMDKHPEKLKSTSRQKFSSILSLSARNQKKSENE